MNKKMVSLVLSGLIVLNNAACLNSVYADSNNKPKELVKNKDTKSNRIVYLEHGEGSQTAGDGTISNPYQNIRTALKNIKDGDTLKIKGWVNYHYYTPGPDLAPLPLYIDKDITIEGEEGATLCVRAPIQLGANVTFKNLNLDMWGQYTLGESAPKLSEGATSRLLGEYIPRSNTIYVAGNELTLDNVDTKFGTSVDQDDIRPYISGGTYRYNYGMVSDKSIINIKNSNGQTRFRGIYAGDYYANRDFDVEINIDKAKVLDGTIHTGGHEHNLTGNVTVNLGENSNITKFDKSNHIGNVDVKIGQNANVNNFDTKNIHNLTLEENSSIILSKDAIFNVNDVEVKNNAKIDFSAMTNTTPIVNGNFIGVDKVDDTTKGGAIFLDNDQTLDIKGTLTGTTRLNNRNDEYAHVFKDGHVYVRANSSSTGDLTIEDSIYDNYELNKVNNGNIVQWTTNRLKEGFGDLKWIGEDNKITNTAFYVEEAYPIEFTNDEGNIYTPDTGDLFTDFKYTLTKPDGTEVSLDENNDYVQDDDVYFAITTDGLTVEMIVGVYTNSIEKGKFVLTVTHKATNKSISKNIHLVKDTDILSGSVSITGSPIEGNTISADISNLPQDIQDVKYKWYVKDSSGEETLVTDQTSRDFVLKNEYVDKTIKVVVEAMNYNGTITSSEVKVKSQAIAPVIEGLDPIEIKAGEVDAFNTTKKLENVTAKDYNQNPINNIDVLDKVEKPEAGTDKTFDIRYSVTDTYGNTIEKIRKVTVTNQKPSILGAMDLVIAEGESYDVKDGIIAKDKEDGDISSEIKCSHSDLSNLSIGMHTITYTVTDSDKNTTTQEVRVFVNKKTSQVGPQIQGANDITLKVSEVDEFNKNHKLTDVIVSDDIDKDVQVTVSGEVGKPLGGNDETYELIYTAIDSDSNKTTVKRKVTVTNRKPVISGLSDISITEGDSIDPKLGVIANDYEDGNITKNLVCLTDLNTLMIGENILHYTITDADGNKVDATRKVIVSEKVEQQPEVPEVPETKPEDTVKPETPEVPETKPEDTVKPETPEVPETKPEDTVKPELPVVPETSIENIIENIQNIEGIKYEEGNATVESPIAIKVDTVDGLNELLTVTDDVFDVVSVEEVKEKEEDNFLIYLLKITKKSLRTDESYFMEIKVAKYNQEAIDVIEELKSTIDKDNTNSGNDTTLEDESNNNSSNNTTNNNTNSSSNNNNSNNNNNLNDNSNETNKDESPKTYDGGIGSYILSGISSIGVLGIFNRRNKRKNRINK